MKKGVLILIIAIILIGLGVGIYFLTQKKETNTNANANINTNSQANLNVQKAQPVNYSAYSGPEKRVVFNTVTEWTTIAPEEVEKSLTSEMKDIYNIIYYGINPETVILAISQRTFEKGRYTLSEMLDEEVKTGQSSNPDYRIEKIKQTTDYITFNGYFNRQTVVWVSVSKATFVSADPANDYYYLMELTMPESLKARYSDIIDDLLNSFQKAP